MLKHILCCIVVVVVGVPLLITVAFPFVAVIGGFWYKVIKYFVDGTIT